MSSLRFTKRQRLRSRGEFLLVRQEGQLYRGRYFFVGIRPDDSLPSVRVGIVTGRKYGNAVERAKIRRLVRELFRLSQMHFILKADMVIVPKPNARKITSPVLREELIKLWSQSGILKK